jgi:hypothetical protein
MDFDLAVLKGRAFAGSFLAPALRAVSLRSFAPTAAFFSSILGKRVVSVDGEGVDDNRGLVGSVGRFACTLEEYVFFKK